MTAGGTPNPRSLGQATLTTTKLTLPPPALFLGCRGESKELPALFPSLGISLEGKKEISLEGKKESPSHNKVKRALLSTNSVPFYVPAHDASCQTLV